MCIGMFAAASYYVIGSNILLSAKPAVLTNN